VAIPAPVGHEVISLDAHALPKFQAVWVAPDHRPIVWCVAEHASGALLGQITERLGSEIGSDLDPWRGLAGSPWLGSLGLEAHLVYPFVENSNSWMMPAFRRWSRAYSGVVVTGEPHRWKSEEGVLFRWPTL
jgi:hypothetical protein